MAGLFVGFSAVQVIRSFGDAITQFSEFNQGMRNVASVSGATRDELELLTKTALDLASATRFNPKQATEGLYSLASAGQTVNQQIATLPNVLNLAEAAQSSLASATELTVSTMAQFNIEADDSQRVVDVFTASIANSSTNVERLLVAMRNSGATANAFNQSFEQSVGVVSILTTAFGNGEKAGTGYKALLSSLAKNAEDMGIDISDAAGKMRPLGEIIDEIKAKGLPATEIMKTFGDIAGPSLAILLQEGSEGIQEMTDKLTSNGQAADTAGKQMDTLKGDYDQLGSATDTLKIAIGALTESSLRPFIQGITEMVNSIKDNLPEIIKSFKTLGSVIGSALVIKGLIAVFGGLSVAGGILATSIRAVTIAIAGLATVGGGILRFFSGWVGLLASAGVGLYTYITATDDTTSATSELKEETKSLIERNKELLQTYQDITINKYNEQLTETIQKVADLVVQQKAIEESYRNSNLTQEQSLIGTKSIREEIASYQEQIKKLGIEIFKTNEAEKKNNDILSNKPKIISDATKAAKGLIKSLKDEVKQLANQNIKLKLNKKAYKEYVDIKLIAMATSKEELQTIVDLIAQRDELNTSIETSIQTQKDETASRELAASAMQDYIDKYEPARNAIKEHQDEIAKLDLLLDKQMIGWVEYQVRMNAVNKEFQQAKVDIKGMNDEASKSKGIFGQFFDGLKAGFEDVISSLKDAFSGVGGTATLLDTALQIKDAFANNDSTTRAIFESAQAVADVIKNPIVDAVLAIVGSIDALFGGKLLGTNFEVSGSGFSGGTTGSGASGSQFITEQRERSFFRGTQTRTTTSALDDSILSLLEAIGQSGIAVAQQTATALGINVAQLVTGEISQNFDADGNLVSSFVTVLGRTYNEGIEEFGKRILAENILAQLSVGAQDVEVTQTQFANIGEGFVGGGFDTTVIMNEIEALSNRWRDNAELLLEGAQFLLVAQTDLNSGFDLLQDGSLTSITNIVEELNQGGETLTDTYVRLAISAQNLDLALELSGIALSGTREEVVRFAADITNAAGGLEAATGLWSSYFQNYFSGQELIVNQLSSVNDDITTLIAEIGQDVNFDNFREEFENALPDLSPQEVVQWLKLGDALGVAHDLAGRLAESGLSGALSEYVGLADDMALASQSLAEQMQNNTSSIRDLIVGYDGSIASENEIATALSSRYNMELAFIEQIRSASLSIDAMISNSIDNILFSQMTDEERYATLKERADALAASIDEISDPAELEAAIAEINRLQAEAFGILDEGQQSELAGEFVEFLEEVNRQAQEQLEGIELNIANDSDSIVTRLQEMLIASQEREDVAIQNFDNSVVQFNTAVNSMQQVAARLDVIDINVNVNNSPFQEVNNV